MIRKYLYNLLAKEISRSSPFYDEVYYFSHSDSKHKEYVLGKIQATKKTMLESLDELPVIDKCCLIVCDGTLNIEPDIQAVMEKIYSRMNRKSRLVVVGYNSYIKPLYKLANFLRLRKGPVPQNFITHRSLKDIARLAKLNLVGARPVALMPIYIPLLSSLINWLNPIIPFLQNFSLATLITYRPHRPIDSKPLLSVVIPVRNEAGNVTRAIKELLPVSQVIPIEVLFVEGHSKDNTWDIVLSVEAQYKDQIQIQSHQQTGVGKNNAVRLGFEKATGELLTILDGDLTVEPAMLPRFYTAYIEGYADFINGNRLTLPMEKLAMFPLNLLGNIFFAKLLGYLLQIPINDSLCGTKLLSREDYFRVVAWRKRFGDFDPFGDFELLFGVSELALSSVDVPILYKARTYGETNISRFIHGFMLLKMSIIGFFRIRLGKT